MIIDSHQHVFWNDRDDAGLVADLDQHKIDVAWLLSWDISPQEHEHRYHRGLNPVHRRPDGTHPGIPLSDLILARDRYPNRFALGYCPNPLLGDAPTLLESAYHMHGARICGEWKFRVLFDDPRCLEVFGKAGKLNMPVVLHLDVPYLLDKETGEPKLQYSWYGGTIENLQRAMTACPETIFIGHAPGFWREISGDAPTDPSNYPMGPIVKGGRLFDLFDNNENLYADLSAGSALKALSRDPEHGKAFVERYADRLLFARDIYGGDLHEFLTSLNLSSDVREKIYTENASKLVDHAGLG
jgi:predicted TIM-barrel fold metal-dependent hydrolase